MMRSEKSRGFSLIELLVSLTVLGIVMSGVAVLLFDQRINRSEQMQAAVQANARNCLSIITQKLRSAGWDPTVSGIPQVMLDSLPLDDVSQIEIYADLDADGATDKDGEQLLIRHIENRIEWRRTSDGPFEILAVNISNDANGDGNSEPMFVPIPTTNPRRIRLKITARSPRPDPRSGEFIVYTVSNEVYLRNAL
jgi:prepilin-type N-terminal cleavage/methylation domain-containing protein